MKNTIIINAINDCNCDLVSNVNDGTNRIFLEIYCDLSLNPTLEVEDVGSVVINSNPFTHQISNNLFVGDGDFTFRIVDDMHTGDYFTVVKIAELKGNLYINQVSNFKYELKCTTSSAAGGGTGQDGVGISNIYTYYLATNLSTGVTILTTGWTTEPQVMTQDKNYLWMYMEIAYTDGDVETIGPIMIGVFTDSIARFG